MIKWRLLMVAAALAAGTAVAGAQERLAPPAPGAHVLPAQDIVMILRSTGFDPVSRPVRVGPRYEVRAFDPDDFEVNLLVDGRTGRILTVRDSDDDWPSGPPPYPRQGFRQAAGRFGPLGYGPLHPGGLVPPRGIPARRATAAVDPHKAPVPKARPQAGQAGRAPALVSNAPVTPTPAAKPSAPAAPVTISTPAANAQSTTTITGGGNAGIKGSVGAESGKKQNATSAAANQPSPAGPTNRLAPSGPPAPDAASPTKTGEAVKSVPVAPLE